MRIHEMQAHYWLLEILGWCTSAEAGLAAEVGATSRFPWVAGCCVGQFLAELQEQLPDWITEFMRSCAKQYFFFLWSDYLLIHWSDFLKWTRRLGKQFLWFTPHTELLVNHGESNNHFSQENQVPQKIWSGRGSTKLALKSLSSSPSPTPKCTRWVWLVQLHTVVVGTSTLRMWYGLH